MNKDVSTPLNGVNIDTVVGLVGKIQEQPEVANTRWNAGVEWKGGFRSQATVRAFDAMPSDEPEALGGSDTGPNPVEQILAALGNCLAVGYAANATVAGIELHNLSIDLEGELDLHAFLGLAPGNAGYERISVKVNIDSDASEEAIRALHQKVTETSPVGDTLSRAIPLNIDLA